MIAIDCAERTEASLDARILLAEQIAAAGHRAVIDETTVAQPIDLLKAYQLAPFVTEIVGEDLSRLIILASEAVKSPTLKTLRSYRLSAEIDVIVLGRFGSRQAEIDARLSVAYALGREPTLVNLNDWQKRPLDALGILPVAGRGYGSARPSDATRLTLLLSPEALEPPAALHSIAALSYRNRTKLLVVARKDQKERLLGTRFGSVLVLELDECTPATLASMSDVVAVQSIGAWGDRARALCLEMMESARPVIDCTLRGELVATGAPALRGPVEIENLGAYMDGKVLPYFSEISKRIGSSQWLRSFTWEKLAERLQLPATARPIVPEDGNTAPRTVFLPTNGNGLGHARRCLLVAAGLTAPEAVEFAAYPSCVEMIEREGYACLPLVQRSGLHREPNAHDILNHLRLRRLLAPSDKLVFDGGEIPRSVFSAIVEKGLSAVWIRRGLWQANQVTEKALEREPVFGRVIVPQEAFEELNDPYSHGTQVFRVDPIVQISPMPASGLASLRDTLGEKFVHPFKELVVTMLGGHSVNISRSAQAQTACGLLERRPDCLHLVVVWPGARVHPGLYGWRNTRIVETLNTLELCRAADLVISAAGYNSFHECLYHSIPTIFVPQTAPFMDDQERRSRAASDRGLAETVLATELLRLEREIRTFLDGGKGAELRGKLAAVSLPECGNMEAARLVEGLGA